MLKSVLIIDFNIFLKLALKMINKTAEQYCNEGIELEKLGKYKDAIKKYEKAVKADEFFAKAHFGLGELSSCLLHDHVQSTKHYMRAIELDPNYLDAYFNLMLEFMEVSRRPYGSHLKLQKEEDLYWEAWELKTAFEKHDEAIKKFEEAIKINQNSVLSYARIGWIYKEEKKDPGRAIEYYKKAIEKYLFLMPKNSILSF